MMEAAQFLSVDDVLAIHEDVIEHKGGQGGVRDHGLLESAVMMAQQQFAGEYLHPDLPTMAAAYLFHISQHQRFHDGNKRSAAMAALVFLEVNSADALPSPQGLERVLLQVAEHTMTKDDLTSWMREELRRVPGTT